MATDVIVLGSGASTVRVSFANDTIAAAAQAAADLTNALSGLGPPLYVEFVPPDLDGTAAAPDVPGMAAGSVLDTVPAALAFGILPSKYTLFVNAGDGLAAVVGAANTTLIAGAGATTLYVNQSSAGEVFLAGGPSYISNAHALAAMTVMVDGGADPDAPGGTAATIDDSAGGSATVLAGGGSLVRLVQGGADLVVGQPGTSAVFLGVGDGAPPAGAATISAAAGATVWFVNQGGNAVLAPGAGDLVAFPGATGRATLAGGATTIDGRMIAAPDFTGHATIAGLGDGMVIAPGGGEVVVLGASAGSATLVGGAATIGGVAIDAPAFTGRATVAGADGYIQGGQAGGNLLESGTVTGAATLVAGGAGDVLLLQGYEDTAILGDRTGVFASAALLQPDASLSFQYQGVHFLAAAGSGTIVGATQTPDTFTFAGAGNYTVIGNHAVPASPLGTLPMKAYAASGGAHITILDFTAAIVGSIHSFQQGSVASDSFDLGANGLTSLTTLPGGLAGTVTTVAELSDGTSVTFRDAQAAVHRAGNALVLG